MGKRFSKKEAVSIVISASRMYRDNFVGKRLLFLMTDKHKKVYSLEVGFDASNFQHLTGLRMTDPNCSHLDFYNRCVEGRMKASDIDLQQTEQHIRSSGCCRKCSEEWICLPI